MVRTAEPLCHTIQELRTPPNWHPTNMRCLPPCPCHVPLLPPGAVSDRLRRVTKEIATLPGQLPLSWDSGVLVAMDDVRMDVLRVRAVWHCTCGSACPVCTAGRRTDVALLVLFA